MDTIVPTLEERYKMLGGTKPVRNNATTAELIGMCNKLEGKKDTNENNENNN